MNPSKGENRNYYYYYLFLSDIKIMQYMNWSVEGVDNIQLFHDQVFRKKRLTTGTKHQNIVFKASEELRKKQYATWGITIIHLGNQYPHDLSIYHFLINKPLQIIISGYGRFIAPSRFFW